MLLQIMAFPLASAFAFPLASAFAFPPASAASGSSSISVGDGPALGRHAPTVCATGLAGFLPVFLSFSSHLFGFGSVFLGSCPALCRHVAAVFATGLTGFLFLRGGIVVSDCEAGNRQHDGEHKNESAHGHSPVFWVYVVILYSIQATRLLVLRTFFFRHESVTVRHMLTRGHNRALQASVSELSQYPCLTVLRIDRLTARRPVAVCYLLPNNTSISRRSAALSLRASLTSDARITLATPQPVSSLRARIT